VSVLKLGVEATAGARLQDECCGRCTSYAGRFWLFSSATSRRWVA